MKNEFYNKVVLVTGGTGSIGSVLVEKILSFKPKQIRVLSRDENKQYYLMEKLGNPINLRFFIGDIRDKERLIRAFNGVDILFHAAALKHVPLCEYNPFEAVKTNIVGSQNVIDAALACNVKKIIAISTDKAVHPNNVMGTSKLMMEKLFTNANFYSGNSRSVFSCVRFGNVAWANGSVLKLWQNQIKKDGQIKVTDLEMTRFFMTIPQAMNLILQTASISRGG
jgi:FlaA1/EpsC-like NDP-sugar epimerase